jgi:hypothetical protein
MCGISAIQAELRVSIQDRRARNLVRGHRAIGLLADSNLVVVPNPPSELLDDEFDFDAWIIPVPVAPEKAIDVIRPLKKNFLGRRTTPGSPTVVMIELAHHSMYASQVGPCDAHELGRALRRNDGDMWAALVQAGTVPSRLQEELSHGLLREAQRAHLEQRLPRRSDMAFNSYAALARAFCWPWVCFCKSDPEADFGALVRDEASEEPA